MDFEAAVGETWPTLMSFQSVKETGSLLREIFYSDGGDMALRRQ